jgi:hypothetical protein
VVEHLRPIPVQAVTAYTGRRTTYPVAGYVYCRQQTSP